MTAAASIDVATPDEYENLIAALTHDRTALARMMRGPFPAPIRFHRSLTFTTDDNTASASSPVLNLTDLGVAFDADKESEIWIEVVAANGANRYKFTTVQRVLGGTNPTLKGIQRFVTECRAMVEVTTDGSTTTVETANCIGPEWWDGAQPLIGAFSTGQATVSWLGANSPVGSLIPLTANHAATTPGTVANDKFVSQSAVSLSNGTSQLETVGGTTDFALGLSAGTLSASAYITPPIECIALIDTSPTPDKVFIGAKGLSSDLVTWNVHVYVTDQRRQVLL